MPKVDATRKPTTVKKPRARAAKREHVLTEEDIRHRAYEIYLQRGAAHGYDLDDWLRAERETLGPHSAG